MKQTLLLVFAFSPWVALVLVGLMWLAGGFSFPADQSIAQVVTAQPTVTPASTQTIVPTIVSSVTTEPTQLPASTNTTMPTARPTAPLLPTIDQTLLIATVEAHTIEEAFPCKVNEVKGNEKSKIYHAPGQRDYKETRDQVTCFITEEAAVAAGYRKAMQ